MADTVVAPNNRVVNFRGKATRERPRLMPFGKAIKSKAQARAMFAAKAGNSTLGIPASVGAEMTEGAKPGAMKGLPARVKAPKGMVKRGRISNKVASSSKYGGKDQQEIDAATR